MANRDYPVIRITVLPRGRNRIHLNSVSETYITHYIPRQFIRRSLQMLGSINITLPQVYSGVLSYSTRIHCTAGWKRNGDKKSCVYRTGKVPNLVPNHYFIIYRWKKLKQTSVYNRNRLWHISSSTQEIIHHWLLQLANYRDYSCLKNGVWVLIPII